MDIFLSILVLSTLVQYITERIKGAIQIKKIGSFKLAPVYAVGIGMLVAVITQIDIISNLGYPSSNKIIGYIITGLIISGGSEAVHEFIAKIRESRGETKGASGDGFEIDIPVIQMLMPESNYKIKSPSVMQPDRIVVHNTANNATARAEINYMSRIDTGNKVSFHFAVDDIEIVQGLPLERSGIHAGTKAGNRTSIGIEICHSRSGGPKFFQSERNAVKLIVALLIMYGWGIEKVTKHQDYSGKYCPHRTLDMGWNRFLDMVTTELSARNQPTAAGEWRVSRMLKPQDPNMTGTDVLALEIALEMHGYDCNISPKEYLTRVGSFGDGCEKAVRAFQKDHPECGTNGKPDGKAGKNTITKLGGIWID